MMMLTEIADVLRNIRYKDWKIDGVRMHSDDQYFVLRVRAYVADVANPGNMVDVYRQTLESFKDLTERSLVTSIWECIRRLEIHEASERFQYKGVAVFNEHLRDEGKELPYL